MVERNKPTVSMSFNKTLIEEIDRRRGILPRSLYVEQTLMKVFRDGINGPED